MEIRCVGCVGTTEKTLSAPAKNTHLLILTSHKTAAFTINNKTSELFYSSGKNGGGIAQQVGILMFLTMTMIEITTTVQCNDNDRNYSEKDDSWKCATSVALVGTAGCTFPCKIEIK